MSLPIQARASSSILGTNYLGRHKQPPEQEVILVFSFLGLLDVINSTSSKKSKQLSLQASPPSAPKRESILR